MLIKVVRMVDHLVPTVALSASATTSSFVCNNLVVRTSFVIVCHSLDDFTPLSDRFPFVMINL